MGHQRKMAGPASNEADLMKTTGVAVIRCQDNSWLIEEHADWLRLGKMLESSVAQRRKTLIRLAAFLPVPLAEATPAHLMAWRRSLRRLRPATIACYVGHVQRAYAWLVEEGYRPDNPAARVPVPRLPRRVARPISERDLARALRLAPEWIRLCLILAAYAGLRAQEIARLERADIRLHAGVLCLIVTEEAAKGGNERVIPLAPWVIGELGRLLPAGGYCLPRKDGRLGANAPWTVSHHCNRFLREIGIASTLHKLRARFATQMWELTGHDSVTVMAVMGHKSHASLTAYIPWSQPSAIAAVARLPVPA